MKNQKNELRQFGLILSAILAFIGWRLWAKGIWINSLILFDLALLSFILSMFMPLLLKFPHKILVFISQCIGWVNTRLILTLIYYGIFTPMAIFLKIIGKDFLNRTWQKNTPSYWIFRKDDNIKKESYERQF